MIAWHEPIAPVVVEAGKLYRTRGGKTAFVERLHKIPWTYNGERKEYPFWVGVIVDDGTPWAWEFWGTVSPPVYKHLPGVGFMAMQDDLDLIGSL